MHRAVPGAERPWISHQLTAVCGLYLPTSHAAHVPALAFPQPERYVPASQGSQLEQIESHWPSSVWLGLGFGLGLGLGSGLGLGLGLELRLG